MFNNQKWKEIVKFSRELNKVPNISDIQISYNEQLKEYQISFNCDADNYLVALVPIGVFRMCKNNKKNMMHIRYLNTWEAVVEFFGSGRQAKWYAPANKTLNSVG